MLAALCVASLVGLASGLGALPYVVVGRIPRRPYDALLGVGAGLMLGAATVSLLGEALAGIRTPDGVDGAQLATILAGFATGAALLVLLDRLVPHHHAGGHAAHEIDHEHADEEIHRGLLIGGAMALHRLPEGFALGAGFAAGGRSLGLVLAIAIALQNACEGLVLGAPLRRGGMPGGRVVAVVAATGFTLPLAAAAGYLLAVELRPAMRFFLALAAGALVYVTSNEIIPETHSHGNERLATFGVISGFLVTLLLQGALGD